jgi:ABC-type lipoprotein export system ATPase subunit
VEILALLQELWHAGMTIVLVTHETDIAAFASRVLGMRDGQVISDRLQQAQRAEPEPEGAAA